MAYSISDRGIEGLQATHTNSRSLTGDTHDLKHVEMSISNANSSGYKNASSEKMFIKICVRYEAIDVRVGYTCFLQSVNLTMMP